MQITTAKLVGVSAAVALAAGAAGGVAGASLAGGSNAPAVNSDPKPTVTATAPTLPAEVQEAPEAPAEIVQQIEENTIVNDVDITEARIYTVADIDVVVAVVSSVDVDVNAVGIWTMENNVIVGAANEPAAETTDFEQVDPPAEVAVVAAEAEAPLPAAAPEQAPAAVIAGLHHLHWEAEGKPHQDVTFGGPYNSAVVQANGHYYVAMTFTTAMPNGGHTHTCGVWVGDSLSADALVPAESTAALFTPQRDLIADAGQHNEGVQLAMQAVGFGYW